jgi:hypothetical protein
MTKDTPATGYKKERIMKKLQLVKSGKFLRAQSKSGKIAFLMLLFLTMGFYAFAQIPTVTVRFYNPSYDCETQTYCLDVQFKSDAEGQKLFGVNVRFYYDDDQLEFTSFGNYAEGYGPYDPDPPIVQTGPATSGPLLFGFTGDPAEYINGDVQVMGYTPIFLDTEIWTTIFSICFTVEDPTLYENGGLCPPIVWDLEENPENGGFSSGSDGVVILLVSDDPYEPSTPAISNVVQFNWAYDGSPGYPYGNPVPTECMTTTCDEFDLGDAPEGVLAYPNLGVTGLFPTCLDTVLAGYISHFLQDPILVYFGPAVDPEADGNAGSCSPYAPYNNDECFQDQDAGLIIPSSYTIYPNNKYYACSAPGSALCKVGDTVIWGPGMDLDIFISNLSANPVFVNLLIDWNLNGKWEYDPNTMVQGNVIPEHCLVNFPVPPGFIGPLSQLFPPSFYSGPLSGYAWSRFSVTDAPVMENWEGEGTFATGETEDYLFKIDPRKEIPLSDWALVIGALMISAFTIARYRKN